MGDKAEASSQLSVLPGESFLLYQQTVTEVLLRLLLYLARIWSPCMEIRKAASLLQGEIE